MSAAPFTELNDWQDDTTGARVVAFGNLKGGVGKTTLAANFGAYVAHDLQLPVLFVDLDFQASLSNLLIQAWASSETVDQDMESRIEQCFADRPDLDSFQEAIQSLAPKLPHASLIASSYQFAQFELDEAQLAAWVQQASLLPGERM